MTAIPYSFEKQCYLHMKKILLFASGTGSNVENIIKYFKNHHDIIVAGVYTNNPNAKVLDKAKKHNVPTLIFNREQLRDGFVLDKIAELKPDLIVLAGFLWKMPEAIVEAYPNKIINIHPALLPKYGGKGMYGAHVHNAVSEAKMHFSGITIHLVNEEFDKGKVLAQFAVALKTPITAVSIEAQVRLLEITHFPLVVESAIRNATIV